MMTENGKFMPKSYLHEIGKEEINEVMDISNITNSTIFNKTKQIYTKSVVRILSINRCK